MRLTIHGPNLRDQSKGTFHVHAADCRDNAKEVRFNCSESPITIDADSIREVVEFIYEDQIAENEPGSKWSSWEPYADDFHFAPCLTLPESADD